MTAPNNASIRIDRPDAGGPGEPPGLELELALQLLQHAGYSLPALDGVSQDAWLQALIDGLCRLSSRDPLTGLANRREFELALVREIDRGARTGEPALLLMIDIDRFKQVNDSFGHPIGDLALVSVAKVLQASIRPMDTVARVGGEEFAVILPNCPFDFGLAAAERVRLKVANLAIAIGHKDPLTLTVSVGGAFSPVQARPQAKLWMERADAQLYRAKAEGRNRSCLEPPVSDAEAQMSMFGQSWFHTPE
ncbi:MAG: GGDEF domain-containing protein [Burkholderiaceae bacterium]